MQTSLNDSLNLEYEEDRYFDFEGTIADTLDLVVGIVNMHADFFGHKKVTKEDIPHLQEKNQERFYHFLEFPYSSCPYGQRRYKKSGTSQ